MVAIIPAAGLGKRMASVTGGLPKELLRIGGRPVIERTIHEALEAGAEPVYVISSMEKPELNAFVFGLDDTRVVLAFQEAPLGLAHAVDCAGVNEDTALVLMADSFFAPASPLPLLKARVEAGAWACAAVRQVPQDQLHLYGVAAFDEKLRMSRVVEKPKPEEAPSDWAVSGRFGLSADAMETLHQAVSSWDGVGEINLSVVLRAGLATGKAIYAVPVPEETKLYDCGDPEGYQAALEALGA